MLETFRLNDGPRAWGLEKGALLPEHRHESLLAVQALFAFLLPHFR